MDKRIQYTGMFSNINLSGNIYKYIDRNLNSRSLSDTYRMIIYMERLLKYSIKKYPHNFPTIIQIQTINQCNAACTICPYSSTKSNKIETMSDQLFENIVKEIANQNEFSFIHLYLQNEPLLDKNIFDKVKLIKRISNGKIAAGLVTNGSLFTDEKIRELEESGNDILVFSLDAITKETYEKIRKGLNFDVVINNINKVLKTSYSSRVFVKFVVQKDNYHEVKNFKNYWKERGVGVLLSNLSNRTGDLEDYNDQVLLTQKIGGLEDIKKKLIKHVVKNCKDLLLNFNILTNGNVILCCNDYSKKIVLGNVNENSVKEIWKSKKYNNIRRKILSGNSKDISVCNNCSIWNFE